LCGCNNNNRHFLTFDDRRARRYYRLRLADIRVAVAVNIRTADADGLVGVDIAAFGSICAAAAPGWYRGGIF